MSDTVDLRIDEGLILIVAQIIKMERGLDKLDGQAAQEAIIAAIKALNDGGQRGE